MVGKKNIELFISRSRGGGAERAAMNLYNLLKDEYDIKIVTILNDNHCVTSLNIKLFKAGIFTYPIIFILALLKYGMFRRQQKTDVVVTFLLLEHIISSIINKNVKKIFTIHTSYYNRFEGGRLSKPILYLIGFFLRKADHIVAVSEGVKSELVNKFSISNCKISVIYNPVNLDVIQEMSRENITDDWYDPAVPYIVNISRLEPKKGHEHLIKSFNRIKDKTDALLIICGTGSRYAELSKLIESLNLSKRILLIGWVDNPYKYLNHSSIFISTSELEALPYAIIEALSIGTNIISTNCEYGPDEILEGGRLGVLIPFEKKERDVNDEEILANIIEDLLLIGRNSEVVDNAKISIERFSIIRVKHDYMKIINQII